MIQQANLIEPTCRPVFDWLTAESLAIATAVTIAIIGGGAIWATARADGQERLATRQAAITKSSGEELAVLGKLVADNKPNTELANELADAVALLNSHMETIQAIESGVIGGTAGFAEFMRGFARQTPNGLWLTGFTIGASEDDLEVRGRMTNPSSLTEYIRRLKTEPVFEGRSFAALAIDKSTDAKETGAFPAASSTTKEAPPSFVNFILKPSSPDEIAAAAMSESLQSTRLASAREFAPRRANPIRRSFVDPVLTPHTENVGKAAMEELAKANEEQSRTHAAALKKVEDLLPGTRKP